MDNYPSIKAIAHLQELFLNGKLDPDLEKLKRNPQFRSKYVSLRQHCDATLQNLRRAQHASDASGSQFDQDINVSLNAYLSNLSCVANILCPNIYKAWADCVTQSLDFEESFDQCGLKKRMLERCLRSETESMLGVIQHSQSYPRPED
ncbi:hypothetical protein ABG067_001849 [Albugo candida]|uniref:Uncharacterized protein n=1 Tax=Albugo candida TaxID=65357 RepID=A0A024GL06_9STRA|nr:unnamed protein product [Albugo candida]|eukprot:CCI47021.1 unnamed protein product [Albugo candida]